MGEETKIEKMFLTRDDGTEVEWNGIKSVTTDLFDYKFDKDGITLGPYEWSFTATTKYPKFWRCKNRKRYKKLLMSLGVGRNYADWLIEGFVARKDIWPKECDFSYQELWNEIRINTLGF